MPENACQGCSLCCKLMRIEELDKPRCSWCSLISKDKQSCTVYHQREEMKLEGCIEWKCGWLSSQESDIPLPEECKPNKSHIVISRTPNAVWFHCDPGYPEAWRKGKIGELLNKLVDKKITVYVLIGQKRIIFRKGQLPIYVLEEIEPLPMLKDLEDYA